MIQNTLFVTKTTAFMAMVEKIITLALGEEFVFFYIYSLVSFGRIRKG